jgi:hypothetical protein
VVLLASKSILSSDVESILRRLKAERRREPLTRRSASELPFAEHASHLPRALLYDTTVYIDILQDRFPKTGDIAIRAADAWHSTVTEAELIALWVLEPGPSRDSGSGEKDYPSDSAETGAPHDRSGS